MLNNQFAFKYLGELFYFLDIEVNHMPNGDLLLTKCKYICQLLAKACVDNANAIATLISTSITLSTHIGEPFEHPIMYISLVRALQHLCITRPVISYTVNKTNQFMSKLFQPMACYQTYTSIPSGHINHGSMLRKSSYLQLHGDANWASSPDKRCSTFGIIIFLTLNPIMWSNKKQGIVYISSTKAEYRLLAYATSKLVWIQSLLIKLSLILLTFLTIWCDNLTIIVNPTCHV